MTHRLATTVVGALMIFAPLAAHATQRVAVLTVEKATCSLCAPIVKGVLSKVEGVKDVKIAEASGEAPAVATVAYDDAVTNVAALTAATTNAGYPSHLKH
jgi:mercuric ion binding protein